MAELVKTALESLGNSEYQSAIDAFNRAAVQDITGATVAFEVHQFMEATFFRFRHYLRRIAVTYVLISCRKHAI